MGYDASNFAPQGNGDLLGKDDIPDGVEIPLTISEVTTVDFNKEGEDDPKNIKLALGFVGKEKILPLNATRLAVMRNLGDECDEWIGREVIVGKGDTKFEGRPTKTITLRHPAVEASADDISF